MPRYFFHTQIGESVIADDAGKDLRDPDHAWEEAKATIQASLKGSMNQALLMAAILVVRDESGEVVFEFPFAEAVGLPTDKTGTVH